VEGVIGIIERQSKMIGIWKVQADKKGKYYRERLAKEKIGRYNRQGSLCKLGFISLPLLLYLNGGHNVDNKI